MSYDLQPEGKIRGIGEVKYVMAPFDQSTRLFKESGLEHITAYQLARARKQRGFNSSFMHNGSTIREGVLYVPSSLAGKASIVLVPESLVFEDLAGAVAAHRSGREATYRNKVVTMQLLEQAKTRSNGLMLLEDLSPVRSSEMNKNELAKWLFKNFAGEYGQFLEQSGISQMPLIFDVENHIDAQEKPYVNQLWLGGRDSNYLLYGSLYVLNYNLRARGVSANTAGGGRATQPTPRGNKYAKDRNYTLQQISAALANLNISGLEKSVIATLRKSK